MKKETGFGSSKKKEKIKDGFEERVVQVRRVTKVVKGGKQLHFRATRKGKWVSKLGSNCIVVVEVGGDCRRSEICCQCKIRSDLGFLYWAHKRPK